MKLFPLLCVLLSVICGAVESEDIALLRKGAYEGNPSAMNLLGFAFYNGDGVEANTDSALFWIGKGAGAGDARAAANLGYLLVYSDRITHDYPQAVKWLEMASAKGLPQAQSMLADLLRQGLGAERDTLRAETLYREAISAGLHDAELKLLAMKGNTWHSLPSDALLSLAKETYLHGAPIIGTDLLLEAAGRGMPEADALLGDAYARGYGIGYDHEKSMEHYLKGALGGVESAREAISGILEFFPDALSAPNLRAILESHFAPEPVPAGLFPNTIPDNHR